MSTDMRRVVDNGILGNHRTRMYARQKPIEILKQLR